MKSLHSYISERFSTDKDNVINAGYIIISNKTDLEKVINKEIHDKNFNGYLDMRKYDISNIKGGLSNIFANENRIKTVDIRGWNTKNVTSMFSMFYDSENLESILGLQDLNVSNVENMAYMFSQTKIDKIDLSKWKPKNNIDCHNMFYDCKKLTSIGNISHWTSDDINKVSMMFSRCDLFRIDDNIPYVFRKYGNLY